MLTRTTIIHLLNQVHLFRSQLVEVNPDSTHRMYLLHIRDREIDINYKILLVLIKNESNLFTILTVFEIK